MSADPMAAFLNRLHHPALANIDMKLDRMLRLLSMVGSPHKKLPPVIHVAGTNGKGSTIAYTRAIFEAAGYKVHVYTSPHLVQFRERIVLAGKMIDNQQVMQIANYLTKLLEQQPATFFEATTAMAFLAFASSKADVLLLETGMGGRLDCTNVIDAPLATAITPIDFDHMEFLGDTIEKIAGEKAGILKKSVPCIIGRQRPEALAVLEAKATELSVPLFRMGHEWQVEHQHYIADGKSIPLAPSLAGAYQLDNAAMAAAIIQNLPQFTINDAQIAQGIASAVWLARLQKLVAGPCVEKAGGRDVWLDGGHNPQGGQVLAAWLATQNRPVYMVCGMVGKKDADGYMNAIAPHVKALYAVSIPGESTSKNPAEVASSAEKAGIPSKIALSVEQAVAEIAESAPESALVLIAGSLYLAGFILQIHR